jgi:multidrug efflux pump subunit AcrB
MSSIVETDIQANIETLKQYLNLGVKLIPVYDNGAFISTGVPRGTWGQRILLKSKV